MKYVKSPRIVTSMFLRDGLTVVNLIVASPFFNSIDDPVSGIVYTHLKISGHGRCLWHKMYMTKWMELLTTFLIYCNFIIVYTYQREET